MLQQQGMMWMEQAVDPEYFFVVFTNPFQGFGIEGRGHKEGQVELSSCCTVSRDLDCHCWLYWRGTSGGSHAWLSSDCLLHNVVDVLNLQNEACCGFWQACLCTLLACGTCYLTCLKDSSICVQHCAYVTHIYRTNISHTILANI